LKLVPADELPRTRSWPDVEIQQFAGRKDSPAFKARLTIRAKRGLRAVDVLSVLKPMADNRFPSYYLEAR
jgi:succinate dehydrogenase flavin-adding protein (antitoxin of CptAB toxin-antitoxin module)